VTKRVALFVLTLCVTAALSMSAHAQIQFHHNGSYMYILLGGYNQNGYRSIEITYDNPRPGMRAAGARIGSVLFHGVSTRDGRMVRGIAYIFKAGCAPAPYQVEGRYEKHTSRILLYGAYPVFGQGCRVVGYSTSGHNARLSFEQLELD